MERICPTAVVREELAALRNRSWHTFRHTYSTMRSLGVELKVQPRLCAMLTFRR